MRVQPVMSGAASVEARRSVRGPRPPSISRRPFGRAAAASGIVLLVGFFSVREAIAQPEVDLSHWRFYSSVEGLRESWVEDITAGQNGRQWITHGTVDSMTVFDGYTFQKLPTPGSNLTVREGPSGQVWALHRSPTFLLDGLQIFERDVWAPMLPAGVERLQLTRERFVPWAHDRVLLVGLDTLSEFDRPTRTPSSSCAAPPTCRCAPSPRWRRNGPAAPGSAVAVSSSTSRRVRGLATSIGTSRRCRSRSATTTCATSTTSEATASSCRRKGPTAARRCVVLENGAWRNVLDGVEPGSTVLGWAAADEMWQVTNTGRTFVLARTDRHGTERLPVRRSRALSGQLHSVLVEPSGAFWISTSLGLARHAPTVWRTPTELGRFERHISSLFESRSGMLYALAEAALLVHRQRRLAARCRCRPASRPPTSPTGSPSCRTAAW